MKLLLTLPYVVLAVLLVAFTILLKILYLVFLWLPCFLLALLWSAIKYLRGDVL